MKPIIHQANISSQRILPTTGEIYHVYNRGVEKRDIFKDRIDRVRFIHNLFEFNDTKPAPEFSRRYQPESRTYVGRPTSHIGKPVVDVLSFCLMANHYHLLLRQKADNGIPLFMKKLGGGYTRAFNDKNERVGPLFQGKYKFKHIDREEYLQNIICYIHLNPLNLSKEYSESKKVDFAKTWESLNRYRWSSHLDYLGQDNFGSVLNKRFILELFDGVSGYKTFVQDYIKNEAEKMELILPVAMDAE